MLIRQHGYCTGCPQYKVTLKWAAQCHKTSKAHCSAIHPRPSSHVAAWSWPAPCHKDLYTISGNWKHPSCCIVIIITENVTLWACLGCSGSVYTTACSRSCQYPATSHSYWKEEWTNIPQATYQQPEQLNMKEISCSAWGKWWSHQYWLVFWPPPHTAKVDILEWPFIVGSLRLTFAITMLFNLPHLWDGWINSAKENYSPT